MSISTTPKERQFGGGTVIASDAELRHMKEGVRAARQHENRHGEFKCIIDCEDVVCDAMHDSMAATGDYDMLDGDVFYELSSYVASAYYAGDFGRHG